MRRDVEQGWPSGNGSLEVGCVYTFYKGPVEGSSPCPLYQVVQQRRICRGGEKGIHALYARPGTTMRTAQMGCVRCARLHGAMFGECITTAYCSAK